MEFTKFKMKNKTSVLMVLACAMAVSSAVARPLASGMSGDDVKKWQMFLSLLIRESHGGSPLLPVNGKFGPATKKATLRFQKRWDLRANGIVGGATINRAKEFGYDSVVVPGSRRPSSNQPREVRLSVARARYGVLFYLKNMLPDPDSTIIISWGPLVKDDSKKYLWDYTMKAKYRGPNRSGEIQTSERTFCITSDGTAIGFLK